MNKDAEGIESFETVYETVFPLLYRIAFHITGSQDIAEEMCQEAFIRYFKRTSPLPSIEDAKYWLIRVVKNLCYNHEKRRGREHQAYRKVFLTPARIPETGETLVLKTEAEQLIQKALLAVPYKLRSPLVLKEYGEMNYRQIAKVLGISEGNVKVRIFRARQALEKILITEDLHVS